ncbi:MAG: ABC transporter ATP-binding protein/permease [Bacilli bacterium]
MLEIKNVSKSYKIGDYKQTALEDINIKFRKSEFVCILGTSGSGKTTLLNLIGGLDNYDSGDLIINGKSTKKFTSSNWDAYRNSWIGFIFQNYNLINHISVIQNVEIAMTLSGVGFKKRRKKALQVLEKVGLKNHVNKKPSQLSGGQMQRVAIARALVNDPNIILADEPTGALDSKTSVQIMDLIKKVAKDKLVIMVTHNADIAKKYSNRIIKLSDGSLISDTNPLFSVEELEDSFKIKKTSMNFITALKLSLNNVFTKKGRTVLTSFASSIGIIGIALILSLSNGFNKQINKFEKETLSSFPVGISSTVSTISEDNFKEVNKDKNNKGKVLYSYNKNQSTDIHHNIITKDYINYLENVDKSLIFATSYFRPISFNLLSKNEETINKVSNRDINFTELPQEVSPNDSYFKKNYDLLNGSFPNVLTDIILIVDSDNRVDETVLNAIGIKSNKEVPFSLIVGRELKLVRNDNYYKDVYNDKFVVNEDLRGMYDNANNKTLKIVGIVRCKKNNNAVITGTLSKLMGNNDASKLAYSSALVKQYVLENKESRIVKAQEKSNNIVFMGGASFEEIGTTKQEVLTTLAANDDPIMLSVYPKDFKKKEELLKYLDKYNRKMSTSNKVIYTDYAKEVASLSGNIMDGITIILIAFSSISLIVSSIMIGIITYISVLERTREIGILRSIGARKKDVSRVFNAETFIVGTVSGLIGILITIILIIPINKLLYIITDLKDIAQMNPSHAVILVIISVTLTLIGGYIPSKIASKKNLVNALKSE